MGRGGTAGICALRTPALAAEPLQQCRYGEAPWRGRLGLASKHCSARQGVETPKATQESLGSARRTVGAAGRQPVR